ncbi:OS9 isoform 20 [Pan troglodytes]|uniref:OS9 endoplasmic reticulum lectin n=3 Tax=Hominidae TaxID=9604 RepID=F8VWQ2_HUMAN|nr:OS9 endoplasmic reticulum lectin [Homo sapiens]PNI39181.1 OS9 isoform 19 [Pan troglodytes]PNJ44514.1 OS9 isoform 19 [Pongo abelii]KAI2566664.1 OS9 endoplasmic reticulum lectin [Homo sapiens]KAI4066901.1 OS9 endoplasmic reticulum lectin [Homo sapiens]
MAAETLLSSLLGLLLLGLLLPASLTGGVGSLNLEELSEMRYGIEILPLPVMGGQPFFASLPPDPPFFPRANLRTW